MVQFNLRSSATSLIHKIWPPGYLKKLFSNDDIWGPTVKEKEKAMKLLGIGKQIYFSLSEYCKLYHERRGSNSSEITVTTFGLRYSSRLILRTLYIYHELKKFLLLLIALQ